MKRISWIFLGLLILTLFTVTSVLAFGMGNVDGVWEYIQDITETSTTPRSGEGADCSRWASGNGDSASETSDWNTTIQSRTSTTDENQVRYGLNGTSCRTFGSQSGFGFDGNNTIGTTLQQATPFWLGRFTHYNNPVNLSNPPNFMEWADLDLTVTGIVCGNGALPNEGSTLSFISQIQASKRRLTTSRRVHMEEMRTAVGIELPLPYPLWPLHTLATMLTNLLPAEEPIQSL